MPDDYRQRDAAHAPSERIGSALAGQGPDATSTSGRLTHDNVAGTSVDSTEFLGAPKRLELFPVPVFSWRWQHAVDQKSELIQAIRQRQLSDPGMQKTNRNGWHSQKDLQQWPDPSIQALVHWVVSCTQATSVMWREGTDFHTFGPWRMNAWANVNPPGGYNAHHHHAHKNWHWSACYYVHLDEITSADLGGALVFEDRSTGLDRKSSESCRSHRIVPEEGQLIIFPSWLLHRVEPHRAAGDRISIAFNLHNPAIERSRLWQYRPPRLWRLFPHLMQKLAMWRGKPDLGLNAPPVGSDFIL